MMGRLRIALALAALFLLTSCDGGERSRIGIATNLAFAEAAGLAVADAQAEWGELPADTVMAIESFTRAAVAIQSATALAAAGVDAIVGHSSSAASLASAPVYNQNHVVQLSPQSSASAYSEAGPFSFRLVPPDDRQGEFIAQSLRAMPGIERVVVMYVNDDYGRGLRTTLMEALGNGAPEVVGEVPHLESGQQRPDDLDLARSVVEQTRPDAIVWLGRPIILGRYLPMLRSFGPLPIVASDASAVVRAESGDAWRDVRYVDFVDLDAAGAMRDFTTRFAERFGRPATSADVLTYDATRLLLQAVRDGASTGPEIREWLESLGRGRPVYEGITGPIRFDEKGDVDRSYVLVRAATSAPPAAADTTTETQP
jgi:branched-chain amino acid transport system substrate-binding protein